MEQIDQLMEQQKFAECRGVIEQQLRTNDDPELLWRMARCYYMLVYGIEKKPSSSEIKELFSIAQAKLEEGVKKYPDHSLLLTWYAIMIEQIARLGGTDERIKKSYQIRELWDKAVEKDPRNHVAHSCIGQWCYTVTDLPDIKRKLASTFMTTPPNSTFEEARDNMLKSEQLCPKTLIGNVWGLAKTYKKLGDKQKAREYCEAVLQFRDVGNEVSSTKKEAQDMLKHL